MHAFNFSYIYTAYIIGFEEVNVFAVEGQGIVDLRLTMEAGSPLTSSVNIMYTTRDFNSAMSATGHVVHVCVR